MAHQGRPNLGQATSDMKQSKIQNALGFSILLISAAGIAYQVVLMRVLSIAQWHHFAYMIISIAMLGFGASGTVLALLRPRLRGREASCLRATALLLCFSLIGCYALSQKIPFETFELVSQPNQIGYLIALYVVLAIPFFLVSTCITLGFFLNPKHIGRLYFFNMVGSGLGAAGVVGLLYLARPSVLVYVLSFVAGLAHLLLVRGEKRAIVRGLAPLVLLLLLMTRIQPVSISEYKGLSYTLNLPDAEVVARECSPLSVVTAVKSKLIRETPGQISNYPMSELGPLPAQIGMYFDAGAVSPVNDFEDGSLDRFAYLDYVTSALAYRLVDRPGVLVIGAGGGTDILSALRHGARHVTAVEVDPNVLAMMDREFLEFSGRLYRRPDVTAVLAEGRGFLESRHETFDLIQLPLFGSFNAAAAGVHALNESYLYTAEAFGLYISRLSERGALAINCWLKTPPRDAIKLFATAVEACERAGIRDPGQHLAFIRSWNNATIVVTRSPLTRAQVGAIRGFCSDRGLDICYCPGVRRSEANIYTVLEQPVYFEAAKAILSPARDRFYNEFLFYVRPATDDRPYFFRFFKWAALPRLLQGMGSEWVPFVEWGYLTLVATVLQSVIVSAVLIVLPLIAFARRAAHPPAAPSQEPREPAFLPGQGTNVPTNPKSKIQNPKSHRWVFAYFAALGGAYMFLEIAFIQKFMLFLAYPVYAVAVVLTAFLISSGLGSLFAGWCQGPPERRVRWAVAGIAVMAALHLAGLHAAFQAWAGWPDWGKIVASVMLLAPMAFCMGIPFPTGLQFVSDRHETLVPWAWGINGCASVVGATMATFTAIHVGFRAVVILAVIAYIVAAASLGRLCARYEEGPCE